jgi:hypothetical protein
MERKGPAAAVWSLSDDKAGNRRQADALARALALGEPATYTLSPRAPWRWVAPRRLPASERAFGETFSFDHLPAVAIGCGRQSALATRLVHARGGRVVQILDPRIDPSLWDLLVVPEHDRLRGPNVLTVFGSLHPVDDAWLAAARAKFAAFALLPQPRIALLLGGASRHFDFDREAFDALADALEHQLVRDGGSLLATVSRRTPPDFADLLRTRFAHLPGVIWCGGEHDGENPYAGLLAWADRIVCTPDSVNMLSEACATRVPVQVFAPDEVNGRLRRFIDALLARGRAQTLGAPWSLIDVAPLRETERIATEVRTRLGLASASVGAP